MDLYHDWNAANMAVMFIFSTFVLLAFANFKLIKTTIGVSNIHNIANITKLHRNINFQSSFCHNSHTSSRYSSVFLASNVSIGVNPLLSPGRSPCCRVSSFFAIFRSLSLGQMHPFTLSTHSSDRHLIFRRIFRRFFVYRTRP